MAGTDEKDRNPWLYGQDAPRAPGPVPGGGGKGGTRVSVGARDVP